MLGAISLVSPVFNVRPLTVENTDDNILQGGKLLKLLLSMNPINFVILLFIHSGLPDYKWQKLFYPIATLLGK